MAGAGGDVLQQKGHSETDRSPIPASVPASV